MKTLYVFIALLIIAVTLVQFPRNSKTVLGRHLRASVLEDLATYARPNTSISTTSEYANGILLKKMCSSDGKNWFAARADGMCYAVDTLPIPTNRISTGLLLVAIFGSLLTGVVIGSWLQNDEHVYNKGYSDGRDDVWHQLGGHY